MKCSFRAFIVIFSTLLLFAQDVPSRAPSWYQPVEADTWVNWTAITDRGDRVVAGSFKFGKVGEFATHCLDGQGRLLWKDTLKNAYAGAFWVAISPEGRRAAAGGWMENKDISSDGEFHGFIRAYNGTTGKLLLDHRTGARVNGVALSKRGVWLAAVTGSKDSRDSKLRLFHEEIEGYRLSDETENSGGSIATMSMSEDGQWLAIGLPQGTVRLFRNRRGRLTVAGTWTPQGEDTKFAPRPLKDTPESKPAKPPTLYVQFLDMSRNGRWLTAALSTGRVCFFDRKSFVATGKPTWVKPIVEGRNVYGVRVSEDGRFVVAGHNGGDGKGGGSVILLENSREGQGYRPKTVWSRFTAGLPNPGLSLDRKGRWLAVADGYPVGTPGHFSIFELRTGRPLWTFQTPDMNWPAALSANGQALVGGSDDGNIYYWRKPYLLNP